MKLSQPIFGSLVALIKNEVAKMGNEPGNSIKKANQAGMPFT